MTIKLVALLSGRCDNCLCHNLYLTNFFAIYFANSLTYLCPTCLHQLHNITAPFQILVTTGIDTKS